MSLKGMTDRKYKLELQTLNEQSVGEIRFYEGLNYAPSISDIGKVTFTIYDSIMSDSGQVIDNEIYSQIKGEMLLLIDGKEYYYISSAKEKSDGTAILEKEIIAYSREYELVKRRMSKYEAESRFLYYIKPEGDTGFPYNESTYPSSHIFDTIDEDGLYTGIFNQIEEMTTWRLERDIQTGYPKIPNTISKKVRGLQFADNSLLDMLNRLQETYECHFSFDTINRIIKVNRFEDLTEHSGIMISDENFINQLEQNIVTEEIKTRIHIQDMDGKGIGDKMPHGGSYVENYEYFFDEMSPNLQNALSQYVSDNNTYQGNISVLWGQYDKLLVELDETYIVLSKKKKEVLPHNETIVVLTEISTGKTLADGTVIEARELTSEEQSQLSSATIEAKRLNSEIQEIETQYKPTIPRSIPTISSELDNVLQELKDFAGKFNMKSMFKEYEITHSLPEGSLYKEMDIYIRDEFVALDYSASVGEIFDDALKIADELGKPRVQIEIEAENLTKMIDLDDLQDMWILGTTIDVKHSKMNVIGQIVLLSYQHNAENNDLKLQFSNKTDFITDGQSIAKKVAKTGYSASKVDIGASAWGKGGYNYKDDASFMAVHLNAVERATELLTGVVTEGYVIMRPNEILIMDTDNPDTAEKVWRMNLNGIGYSSTGINGSYGLAMTMDGQIVADFITTGTLNASKIGVTNLSASSINTGTLNANNISVINLSASSINTGTMSASYIYGGTINGDNVNVTNLSASNISGGTMSADRIYGGTINGNNVNVTNLSASNISAGYFSADRISGGSITGSSISLGSGFSVNTSGYMQASSGKIGNWEITSSYFRAVDDSMGIGISASGVGSLFWGGYSNGSYKFRVTQAGILSATGVNISGSVTATSGSFTGSIYANTGRIGGATFTTYGTGSVMFSGAVFATDIYRASGGSGNIGNSDQRFGTIYLRYAPSVGSGDIRFKKEIYDFPEDLMNEVSNIKPNFFLDDNDKLCFGYIAQDVERALYKHSLKKVGFSNAKEDMKSYTLLEQNSESYKYLSYHDMSMLKDMYYSTKIEELEKRIIQLEGGTSD